MKLYQPCADHRLIISCSILYDANYYSFTVEEFKAQRFLKHLPKVSEKTEDSLVKPQGPKGPWAHMTSESLLHMTCSIGAGRSPELLLMWRTVLTKLSCCHLNSQGQIRKICPPKKHQGRKSTKACGHICTHYLFHF